MHEGSITIRLEAQLPEVERLNRLARQFGELHEIPGRALYSLNLALDELVTNVILYGYEDPTDQQIVVRIEAEPGRLSGVIEDEGREFDPVSAPPPDLTSPLASRELGGLGIHLVRSLMEEVSYRREGAKNFLTIRKRIR
jgi:anti-sigma regulatory factor (Ser/Thr protein kinase)